MSRRPANRWSADFVLVLILLSLYSVAGCTLLIARDHSRITASGVGAKVEPEIKAPSINQGQRPDVKDSTDG